MTTVATLTAAAVSVLLAGCGATVGHNSAASTPRINSSSTQVPSTNRAADPSAITPTATARTSATATKSQGAGWAAAPKCATGSLKGSVADGGPSDPGSVTVALILTNRGKQSCTLHGWPGVSFVGGGNGAQIGNAAVRDDASPYPAVTIAPGQDTQAVLRVTQASHWSSAECEPRVIDGFRVFPPGSKTALFIAASGPMFEACASPAIHQLETQGMTKP